MKRAGYIASLIALVLIFQGGSASALVVNIDNFEVIKNGASLMNDDFNVPGPLNEAGLFPSGAQAFYGLTNSGAHSEGLVAGRRTLDTSAAPAFKFRLTGTINKNTVARLLTNTQPLSESTLGLKRDDTFSVIGIFDLVVPEEPTGIYSVQLEDGDNDVLRIDVLKIPSGNFIRFSHFDVGAVVITKLERIPLETGHEQVMLKLEKLDAGLNTITASFAYIDDGVAGPTTTFSTTRDIFNGEDWTLAAFRALGEVGQTRHVAETTIDHNWASVSLPPGFVDDPVIIAGPPTFHGTQPGVVRLRNVTPGGFEARFQEWLYLDGTHLPENLAYLAITSGRHQMPDGSIWEAGRFSLGGTGVWQTAAFNLPFAAPPALFLTVQTFNGSQPATVRARNVTTSGFEAALFEEEALMDGHLVETVGYLAVHSPEGSGTTGFGSTTRLPYLFQSPSVAHRFTPVLSSALRLEEEQSADPDLIHVPETLSVLAVDDKLFAQDVTSNGGDTAALRRVAPEYAAPMEWGTVTGVNHDWMTVPLAKSYSNPVVVAKPVSTNGDQPGAIRVRNVTANSFELRFQEWLYLDGAHLEERVFYMVAEAGQFTVAGLDVEAGRLNTDLLLSEGWEGVNLSTPFLDSPAVFAGVMTFNGSDPVITRTDNVTSTNFLVTMDEEEAKNDGHLTETLGWIAIERGRGTTGDDRGVVVDQITANDTPMTVPFDLATDRQFPVIAADIMSTRGGDPAGLRYRNLTASSVDLFVQEEQSLDSETFHVIEDVSLFVAE